MAGSAKPELADQNSLVRKFSLLYLVSSVFPIAVLSVFYSDTAKFLVVVCLVAGFGVVTYFFMRKSFFQLHLVTAKLKESLQAPVPSTIRLPLDSGSEAGVIVEAFNELVKRLEANIAELEKSRHMLLQAFEREQMLASTDNLTGIANRRVFYEMTGMEIQKSRRYNRPFTLLMMDIDNFKGVNDTMGHQKGDVLLCDVARKLKECIRTCDVAARLGGDEFAVLLAEAGKDTFETVVPRIRGRLMEEIQKAGWPVTFSIGVVAYSSAPESVDVVIHKADELMYRIKREGKDNVRCEAV